MRTLRTWTALAAAAAVAVLLLPTAAAHSWIHADLDERPDRTGCGESLRNEKFQYLEIAPLTDWHHVAVVVGLGYTCVYVVVDAYDPVFYDSVTVDLS